jgi:hypothetical protein
MKQKKIWMRYLTTGISFFIILLIILSCEEKSTSYRLNVDLIYKNETNQQITYNAYSKEDNFNQFVFDLDPKKEKKIELRGTGTENNLNNCCEGVFEDFQGNSDILIEYNNKEKCLIYSNGEGSTTANINVTYTSREISSGYYEFTYTFTEEEYSKAINCE